MWHQVMRPRPVVIVVGLLVFLSQKVPCSQAVEFRGRVVDAETSEPIPARVYLFGPGGEAIFVSSADAEGSALPYREQWVPMPGSSELHTTVSAHPFHADLPPGQYTLEVERGKEYLTHRETFVISDQPVAKTIRLRRWIDLASRGWYSGETHVHRRMHELANVMLAEDLNVAFPVTFWTVSSDQVPDLAPSTLRRQGLSPFGPREDRGIDPIRIDSQHVIFPRNTEYEIFSVDGKRHVLGAIFLLNHRSVFQQTAPPITPIARQAHDEGALLDLDKHSWPWSMMLVPVAEVDLFELSNNSVWRTQFGFKSVPANPPPWAELEKDANHALTEWGWLNYGFEMYYALLNCGFPLAPTAGTASGVHPVPLGFSRVYVHTGQAFNEQTWLEGLRAGRSFVTTGPMLFAKVDDALPGETFELEGSQPRTLSVEIESISANPVEAIEVLVNGEVAAVVTGPGRKSDRGDWQLRSVQSLTLQQTSWIAVRSREPQPDGRKRFAHTAPWHVVFDNQPITPRKIQVQYFVDLMESEIERNRQVITPDALSEFQRALQIYRERLARSR